MLVTAAAIKYTLIGGASLIGGAGEGESDGEGKGAINGVGDGSVDGAADGVGNDGEDGLEVAAGWYVTVLAAIV